MLTDIPESKAVFWVYSLGQQRRDCRRVSTFQRSTAALPGSTKRLDGGVSRGEQQFNCAHGSHRNRYGPSKRGRRGTRQAILIRRLQYLRTRVDGSPGVSGKSTIGQVQVSASTGSSLSVGNLFVCHITQNGFTISFPKCKKLGTGATPVAFRSAATSGRSIRR